MEAVIIPVSRPSSRRPRTTLCISSQVGCAQNCQFCFTGRMGLQGNLSTAQIVEQVPALPMLRMQSPGALVASTCTSVAASLLSRSCLHMPAASQERHR